MAVWTFRQALTCLVGSTCLTLLLSLGGYSWWAKAKKRRLLDEKYAITTIVQTGPEKEALKTTYLAELLELSSDSPISLYAFDLKKAKERLLSSPLIAEAKVKRIPPNAIYIDYEVRYPIARLADYQNIALDRNGYLFPLAPFFSPKELPEFYLGLPPFGASEDSLGRKGGLWKTPLQGRLIQLAFEVLYFFEKAPWREGLLLKRIDVSHAFSPQLGNREIVLFIEEELFFSREGKTISYTFPKILRLSPKNWTEQLQHFAALRHSMLEDYKRQLSNFSEPCCFAPRIIDLRISQLAFVQNQ